MLVSFINSITHLYKSVEIDTDTQNSIHHNQLSAISSLRCTPLTTLTVTLNLQFTGTSQVSLIHKVL